MPFHHGHTGLACPNGPTSGRPGSLSLSLSLSLWPKLWRKKERCDVVKPTNETGEEVALCRAGSGKMSSPNRSVPSELLETKPPVLVQHLCIIIIIIMIGHNADGKNKMHALGATGVN